LASGVSAAPGVDEVVLLSADRERGRIWVDYHPNAEQFQSRGGQGHVHRRAT
jgi:hypothetical protein